MARTTHANLHNTAAKHYTRLSSLLALEHFHQEF